MNQVKPAMGPLGRRSHAGRRQLQHGRAAQRAAAAAMRRFRSWDRRSPARPDDAARPPDARPTDGSDDAGRRTVDRCPAATQRAASHGVCKRLDLADARSGRARCRATVDRPRIGDVAVVIGAGAAAAGEQLTGARPGVQRLEGDTNVGDVHADALANVFARSGGDRRTSCETVFDLAVERRYFQLLAQRPREAPP